MVAPHRLTRRDTLTAGGLGLLVLGTGTTAAEQAAVTPGPGRETMVRVEDCTNVALTLSPDGKRIAFDLLGILWTMPAGGGPLTRLTGDYDDLAQPDWSPDGRRIVFQSYRTGHFHIWSVAADGGDMRQHTDGPCDDREPRWSPDGRTIAFSSDRADGRYAIYLLDVASGEVTAFSKGDGNDSEPAWSPDGKTIAYVAGGTRLVAADRATGATRPIASVEAFANVFSPPAIMAPAFAPDGTIAYSRLTPGRVTLVHDGAEIVAGEDLYPFRPAFTASGGILYGSDGKIRRLRRGRSRIIPFTASVPVTTPAYARKTRDFTSATARPVTGIVAPMLSPDGRRILFCALNDIYVMPIGGSPRTLVGDGFHKCDPAWSPDGGTIAYSCDRGGTLDLWLHDIASGKERQLTNLPRQAATSGSWSRDGKSIAFLDQEGALHAVDVAGGVRKIFDALWEPGRPTFGPDGRTIACAAFKPVTGRYREGTSQILTIDIATGDARYQAVAPGKSLGVRGLDGPVWSPDGTLMAYVFASTLWVVPVTAEGVFSGPPRQLTTETTDAPSWSGDGRSLLYLSNGKLRLVALSGGAPRTIACRLTWANARPPGRTIIRAGTLWDGVSPGYRTGHDVIVDGNLITAIVPGDGTPPSDANARVIDGSALTLMPGLIDMHTHRQMAGYGYGDRMGRLWLAMGITATRSPGCPAYHMVEDREAIQSGRRIAARHYATGEAIDGGRIFYNFMRPVTEAGQLERELGRARALDYDMVKTYVRLRHDVQRRVVDEAHRMGMPLSSHYHYPALHSGMDGMEHSGATNRYGYSRTSTALGGGYHDVNDLFAAAKAGRTPTLFASTALLGLDDGFVHDPRIRALYPPWEYDKLAARVTMMRGEAGPVMLAMLDRQVAQIGMMLAAGWHPLSGTDAPIDLTAISLHLNLRGMVRCGISPHDALMMTTRWSGEFLGEPIGRIAPGMLADMILTGGDPLADIAAVADVRQVIANGVAHTPATLMAPFLAARPQAAVTRTLPLARTSSHRFWWHDADYVETCRAACCAGHATAHA